MEKAENNDKPGDAQEVALCQNCLAENRPDSHFCHKCNTPLSALASMDPIASIWSRGDTWRKAASRPYRPIILIGMWLLFGIPLLLILRLIAISFIDNPPEDIFSVEVLIGLGGPLAGVLLLAAILFKTTRNYLRQKKQQAAESSDADSGEPD